MSLHDRLKLQQRKLMLAVAFSAVLFAYCWFFAPWHAYWLEAFSLALFIGMVAIVHVAVRASPHLPKWLDVLTTMAVALLTTVLVIVLGACVLVSVSSDPPSTLGQWGVADGRLVSVRSHDNLDGQQIEIESDGVFARAPRALRGQSSDPGVSIGGEVVYDLSDVAEGCVVSTEEGGGSFWWIESVTLSNACGATVIRPFLRTN